MIRPHKPIILDFFLQKGEGGDSVAHIFRLRRLSLQSVVRRDEHQCQTPEKEFSFSGVSMFLSKSTQVLAVHRSAGGAGVAAGAGN